MTVLKEAFFKQQEGKTPLHYAAKYAFVDGMQILLSQGADVRVVDDKGWEPLHYAASENHRDCVDKLLEYGADIHATTNESDTPAMLAEKKSHYNLVQYLNSQPEIKEPEAEAISKLHKWL